jgi:hypothetical protein
MKPCTSPLVVWTISPSLHNAVGKITVTKASENEVDIMSKIRLFCHRMQILGLDKSPKQESKAIYIINRSSSMNPGDELADHTHGKRPHPDRVRTHPSVQPVTLIAP